MLKRDEIVNPQSCLNKAADDELVFVLRARDPIAAEVVEFWATVAGGAHEPDKIARARHEAHEIRRWRMAHGLANPQPAVQPLAAPAEGPDLTTQDMIATQDMIDIVHRAELEFAMQRQRGVGGWRVNMHIVLQTQKFLRDRARAAPAPMAQQFNLNDYVCVRLQPRGLDAIAADPFKAAVHQHRRERDGWTEWQLWELMSTLGRLTIMGPQPPFETTIHLGRLDTLSPAPASLGDRPDQET